MGESGNENLLSSFELFRGVSPSHEKVGFQAETVQVDQLVMGAVSLALTQKVRR